MRMWGVPARKLCRKHLLGEHVEMHMFTGTIKKGISITGYIKKGLVNPNLISQRHDELAEEMVNRGYNHQSPLEFDSSSLPIKMIPVKSNQKELTRRCEECKKLMV